MADREPTAEDILAFMDDDERAAWDSGKGSPEERDQKWQLLKLLWQSIPDPTEDDLKPPYMHVNDWHACQEGRNREGILSFHRRKWKKQRKADAIRRAEKAKQPGEASAQQPFDLSKFDPSTLDLSHLHKGEQNRIRARQFNSQELSMLLQRQNPWTKSGKPEPLAAPKERQPTPSSDSQATGGTPWIRQRGRPATSKELADAELLSFMPEKVRADYKKADADKRKIIWEANKRAFEAAQERKKERLLREQELTEKVLDTLQRVKEDPTKAHLLPPPDASISDLHDWYAEMQKPVRPITFASPTEDWLRRDRISRAIQSGQRPDPNDIAEEEAEKVRYQRRLAVALEDKRKQLDSELTGQYPHRTVAHSATPVAERPRSTIQPPQTPTVEKSSSKTKTDFWAEIRKNRGWYIPAFLLSGLPIYIATLWGPIVGSKTVPQWLAEHGWPRLSTLVIGWVIGVAIITLVIIGRSLLTARREE